MDLKKGLVRGTARGTSKRGTSTSKGGPVKGVIWKKGSHSTIPWNAPCIFISQKISETLQTPGRAKRVVLIFTIS